MGWSEVLELDKIYCIDVLQGLKQLDSESIDCVVTSPPYWGLRDYGIVGQFGLEKTPEEYVQRLVDVFHEVKRVLKKEGNVWLNLGDSYAGSGKGIGSEPDPKWDKARNDENKHKTNWKELSLKPKDLVGIPWRVAFALQNDGWWLRQDIIWSKPNPMPESVTDRCTKSHEYVFLLTKNKDYYYDAEAIKEKSSTPGSIHVSNDNQKMGEMNGIVPQHDIISKETRNKRSVWTVTTKPFSGAHFATFPEDLIEPMIKAGTSEKGICPICGKSWIRIMEKTATLEKGRNVIGIGPKTISGGGNGTTLHHDIQTKTIGWQSSCQCNKEPIPATVLDPFMGAGTTALVSRKLLRHYIGFELNSDYCKIAQERLNHIPQRLEVF